MDAARSPLFAHLLLRYSNLRVAVGNDETRAGTDGTLMRRSMATIGKRFAHVRGQRPGPGLLGGTGVLLIAVLLYGGVALRPFGPSRAATGANRQLLVLRPESSPTGAPIHNIWAIRADGTGLRRVTDEAGEVLDFAVAPDGRRLVVVVRDGPVATALWRINSDGTARVRLTPASDPAVYTDPAWSPAGDLLLYVRRDLVTSRAPGAPATSAIPDVGVPRLWAMTPDGTPLKRVYGQADEVGEAPVWSPDGSTVVFREALAQQGGTDLIFTDLASTPITVPSGIIAHTTWSPDGQWVAYDEIPPGGDGRSQIALIRADGTGRRPLFATPNGYDTSPAWSPDGSSLAFVRRSAAPPPAGAVAAVGEVWAATRDGRIGRRLFGDAPLGTEDLSLSPGGEMLAATRYTVVGAAERGVWVVDADGSRARELVKDATHATWLT
jgi:dipeptidyl aminopeptidase/acylaminoacyl peptidase